MMHDEDEFCCEEFQRMAAPADGRSATLGHQDDGTWSVYGCCGGQCYVLSCIRFCPFCGAPI